MARTFLTLLTAVMLAGICCAQKPQPKITRINPIRESASLETILRDTVNHLIPLMASDNLEERQKAQREFEGICLETGMPGADKERAALCEIICRHLTPDTPLESRVWMLRQLLHIGGDESVATLTDLLSADEPRLSELARRALQANLSQAAGKALRDALKSATESAEQIALLNAIAARRDGEAMELVNEAAQSRNLGVKLAAIAALGEMPEKPVRLFWYERVRNNRVQEAVGDAWIRWADRTLADGREAEAEKVYQRILGQRQFPATHPACVRGLLAIRGPLAVPHVMKIVLDENEDYALRADATRAIAELPESGIPNALAAELANVPTSAKVLILRVLEERADRGVESRVLPLLSDREPEVRIAAAEALRTVGRTDAVMPLARIAADGEKAEREAAQRALARLRGQAIDHTFVMELENAAPPERAVLIRAIADRHIVAARSVITREARHEELAVRVAAYEALGQLATEVHLPVIVERLLKDVDEEGVAAAEDAYAVVASRIENHDKRTAPLLAAWENANTEARTRLLHALGRMEGTAALAHLRANVESPFPDVRDATVRALARWSTAEVLDDLLGVARKAEKKTHRVLALKGYIRLLGLPNDRTLEENVTQYATALNLAERADEKRAVLGGVATICHPDALKLAMRCRDDAAVRAEAEAAVFSLAKLLGGLEPRATREALDRIKADADDDGTRAAVDEVLAELDRREGLLVVWEISGPYNWEGEAPAKPKDAGWVQHHAFAPEKAEATVTWKPVRVTNADQPWVFDLRYLRQENCCVYARCAIWSEAARPARLDSGSDDGIKVWLNGELVHEVVEGRAHEPLADQTPITLHAGWNKLMLKIVQYDGGWGFSCAIRTHDGEPLRNLKYRTAPPKK